MFKFWAARTMSFLREGTYKLGFAKLRSEPEEEVRIQQAEKRACALGSVGVVQYCGNGNGKEA